MLFSEPAFLFMFLPLLLAAYAVIPRVMRNTLLLLASLFFYAWGEELFVAIMLVSIAFNFAIGRCIAGASSPGRRKRFLALGIAGDLGLLGFYKYANFIVDNLNVPLAAAGIDPIGLDPVHLPIGISFFTFQAMSYVIDVYRGSAPVQRNVINVALYISLFPQLIAGPIVRYHDVARQIVRRRITSAGFAEGVQRFVTGLAKKMILANVVSAPADRIFALDGGDLTIGVAWLGALCYTLQIYFDFSGYSDMAIGLGRMFGFRFLENFNYPYISRSITEFWRRWHISLSSWYRDYLYIPLGGNRRGAGRTYLNLVIVFFLCGLWHGASWNFVIWGLFHGMFLIVERVKLLEPLRVRFAPLQHAYTMLVVIVGWVFFRAETLPQALTFLGAMFGGATGDGLVSCLSMYTDVELQIVLAAGILGSAPIVPTFGRWMARMRSMSTPLDLVWTAAHMTGLALLLVYSAMLMAAGAYNPFIYFRF